MDDFRLWLDQQYRLALSCGVLPRRFWEMQPWDLQERAEVLNAQQRLEWERTAFMVHYVLSAWISEPPSIAQLLLDEVVERVV